MRAYFFTNFYLNTISQGIQPAHCIVRMMMKYNHSDNPHWKAAQVLNDWAENHETMICLNGGAHQDIEEIHQKIEKLGLELNLPVGSFSEDQYSLGGIKTCCGIVVPERIYNLAASKTFDYDIQFHPEYPTLPQYSAAEAALAALTRSCPLAR